MTSRNLVVARVGKTSLHHRWLNLPHDQRSFDVLLSFYSPEAFASFVPLEGVEAVLVTGGKFDGLFSTLGGVDLARYDYVWLPDDDIDTTSSTINEIFRLCREYDLAVAQPSLSRDSYFSHFLLNRCPGFRLRYTNIVEVMVPCLRTDLLRRALPYFEGNMSGWGLDYVWCRFPESGACKAAVLDCLEVHHTRPVGQVLKSVVSASGGLSSEEEEERLKRKVGIAGQTVPLAFAGVRTNGRLVNGRLATALLMTLSWLGDLHHFPDRRKTLRAIRKEFQRQLRGKLDLTVLVEG
jgi:hypothetical protein